MRAAAYQALSRLEPIDDMPLRDTPIDQRERIMLTWLDRVAPGLAGDLCEVYAQPEALRFGRTLVTRCLTCHVGPEPTPTLASKACADCHPAVYDQWKGSAHANSTTHLHLVTIDPVTRQQAMMPFDGQPGLACIACHEPVTTHVPIKAGGVDPTCPATFRTVSCGGCHRQAQSEWDTWRSEPRYQRATWPPGSIEQALGEASACVDCHMHESNHTWAARRDPALLRSGIQLSITLDDQDQVVVHLQNLAGHAYPTGTVRRAIALYVQLDDEPERLVATLADTSPTTEPATKLTPALKPNEQRRYILPGSPLHITARLVYRRNRFEPDSYTTEITSATRSFPQSNP